jgi:hypothetical protein
MRRRLLSSAAAQQEDDTVLALMIGITAMLGLLALRIGAFVLAQPGPPLWLHRRAGAPFESLAAGKFRQGHFLRS